MPLKLLLAQFSLFDLFLATAIDNVCALKVDLITISYERVFPPFALFLAFSIGNILVVDSLNLNLVVFIFVVFQPWCVCVELSQGWFGLMVGLTSALGS